MINIEVGQFYFIINPLTITSRANRFKAKVVYILNTLPLKEAAAIKFEFLNAISRHFGWKKIEGSKFLNTNKLLHSDLKLFSKEKFELFYPNLITS